MQLVILLKEKVKNKVPVEQLLLVCPHQNSNLKGQQHVELQLPNNFVVHDVLHRQLAYLNKRGELVLKFYTEVHISKYKFSNE